MDDGKTLQLMDAVNRLLKETDSTGLTGKRAGLLSELEDAANEARAALAELRKPAVRFVCTNCGHDEYCRIDAPPAVVEAYDALSAACEDPDGGNDAEHDAAVQLMDALKAWGVIEK